MKHPRRNTLLCIVPFLALLLGSCVQYSASNPPTPNPNQKSIPKAVFVNPYPVGTYAHFTAEKNYPKTYKTWKDDALYKSTPAGLTRIEISLSKQRAIIYKGDEVIYDYPISSGKKDFPTKPGDFKILEMQEAEKRSNLYGKIYNAEGKVINYDADINEDEVPEGGRFEGALMRYWMRITWSGNRHAPRESPTLSCLTRLHPHPKQRRAKSLPQSQSRHSRQYRRIGLGSLAAEKKPPTSKTKLFYCSVAP